ncbi:uncharacterized protein TNCT_291371 [Trichonephila clavata]|uniref:Uncharacterized protein n=1 Tax=Trichonephila clavata TaxID=2740835 RepID=A0A8X6LNB6_TRICU|nr:uncharacterized protein TNCT_291371 [Trichonephila clavata]
MSISQILPLHDCDVLRQTHNPVSGDFNESCAIIGDNNLLKSSLLFQAAISIASGGDQVFFICPKPLEYRPYHVEGMPEFSPLALQCVKMM